MAQPKKPTPPVSTTPSVVPPVDLKQLPKKGVATKVT